MIYVILTQLDLDHWRVSKVSYYQERPLEGQSIEVFDSLNEAVQFVDDVKVDNQTLEIVKIDNVEGRK